jgi:hypothetical protein
MLWYLARRYLASTHATSVEGLKLDLVLVVVTIVLDALVYVVLLRSGDYFAFLSIWIAYVMFVPGTYNVAIVAGTGISQRTTNITLLIRSGTSQIWPVVFLVVVLVGVASAISFLAIPRGKHVHVVRQG